MNKPIGTSGNIIDLMNKELTQEEWNAIAIVHKLTNRLNMGMRFDYANSVDVKTPTDSQIVDDTVFLSKQKLSPIPTDEYKNKLIKTFIEKYGDDSMAKEKANSFGVGFSKAWDILTKHLI